MQRIVVNITNRSQLSVLTAFVKEKGFDFEIISETDSEMSLKEAMDLFSKPIKPKKKLTKSEIVDIVKEARQKKNARKKI